MPSFISALSAVLVHACSVLYVKRHASAIPVAVSQIRGFVRPCLTHLHDVALRVSGWRGKTERRSRWAKGNENEGGRLILGGGSIDTCEVY